MGQGLGQAANILETFTQRGREGRDEHGFVEVARPKTQRPLSLLLGVLLHRLGKARAGKGRKDRDLLMHSSCNGELRRPPPWGVA